MIEDNYRMTFGKYKGDMIVNVPASYLLWIYDNNKVSGAVKEYIKENYDVLQEEIKRNKR